MGAWQAAAVALAMLLLAAACGAPEVDVRPLPARYPIAWEYPASVEQVHAAVRRLYKLQFEQRVENAFHVLAAEDAVLTESDLARFGAPGGEDDLLLRYGHMPMGLSSVYSVGGRPVPYLADFQLRIEALGAGRTRVEVETIDPQVIAGRTLLPGRHFTRPNIYVPVEATSVEEYRLLLRLGELLGEPDMPPER